MFTRWLIVLALLPISLGHSKELKIVTQNEKNIIRSLDLRMRELLLELRELSHDNLDQNFITHENN
jgi:hypothetical protein